MIARRGFLGRLAGFFGFAALPVQAEITTSSWNEKTEAEDFRANEARQMAFRSKLIAENLGRFEEFSEPMLVVFLPGKLKISKPREYKDGTWTTFMEFRSDPQIGPTGVHL